jgi:hypothetical protein
LTKPSVRPQGFRLHDLKVTEGCSKCMITTKFKYPLNSQWKIKGKTDGGPYFHNIGLGGTFSLSMLNKFIHDYILSTQWLTDGWFEALQGGCVAVTASCLYALDEFCGEKSYSSLTLRRG